MSTILIENGAIVTLNAARQVYQEGYLFIEDDLITAVAPGKAPAQLYKADKVIDADLMAVMPGMVNAHTHLFQTFIRGLADDKPLLDWLKTAIWPVARCLTEEEAYVAALVGMVVLTGLSFLQFGAGPTFLSPAQARPLVWIGHE